MNVIEESVRGTQFMTLLVNDTDLISAIFTMTQRMQQLAQEN